MAKTSKFEEKLLDELEVEIKQKIYRQYVLPGTTHVFDGHLIGTTIIFEVDGDYWHKGCDSMLRDARKDNAALKSGFTVIRIKEGEYKANKKLIVNRIQTKCKHYKG
jgi:very-short-patch-repair endonuclease